MAVDYKPDIHRFSIDVLLIFTLDPSDPSTRIHITQCAPKCHLSSTQATLVSMAGYCAQMLNIQRTAATLQVRHPPRLMRQAVFRLSECIHILCKRSRILRYLSDVATIVGSVKPFLNHSSRVRYCLQPTPFSFGGKE